MTKKTPQQTSRRSIKKSKISFSERLAQQITHWVGSSWAFAIALAIIVGWGVLGPVFNYSDTWQLIINTGTTIITFLMVFLIQRSQNKESQAVQIKLNELLAAMAGASNRLLNVEDLSESELKLLHNHYKKLATMAEHEIDFKQCHSIEETEARHREKYKEQKESKHR